MGKRVVVNYLDAGKGISVQLGQRYNNPEVYRPFRQKWVQMKGTIAPDNFLIQFSPRKRYDERKALVGWLRSAYLVAFAAFGYPYIFHPTLDRVRQQLADPGSNILRLFSVTFPKALPSERHIAIVQHPIIQKSLIVQMGRQLVFLPCSEDGKELYERIPTEASQVQELLAQVTGKELNWPAKPMYAGDRL